MCGICGYSAKENFTPQLRKYADRLVRAMLLETSSRGTDATGYVAHYGSSKRNVFMKRPLPAAKFLSKGYMDFKRMPDVILCHTRAKTSGSPLYNVNNHPFVGEKESLVHNGVIVGWKHKQAYDKYRVLMEGECDSELLLRYYECKGIKHLPQEFEDANYAIGILKHKNGTLTLLRDNSRPLVYADVPELGIFIFASTMEIIRRALGFTFRRHPEIQMHSFDEFKAYYVHTGRISSTKNLSKPEPKSWRSEKKNYAAGQSLICPNEVKHTNYKAGTLYKHTTTGNFKLEIGGEWELTSVKAEHEDRTYYWKGEKECDLRRLKAATQAWEELCMRLLNERAPDHEINTAWESYDLSVEYWAEAVDFYKSKLVDYPEEGMYSE